jgi:hypothetical protein
MSGWLTRLSPRDRRALRLGAWIVLPALFVAFVVRPGVTQVSALRDALDVERRLLSREQAAIATARRHTDHSASAPSVARELFTGRDDVMATAALAAYVGDLAEAQDVWVQSATTQASDRDDAGVRRLRVAVRAEGDVAGLVRLLDALEGGRYFVRVEELEVSVTPSERSSDGSEPLVLRATLSAYATPTTERTP